MLGKRGRVGGVDDMPVTGLLGFTQFPFGVLLLFITIYSLYWVEFPIDVHT